MSVGRLAIDHPWWLLGLLAVPLVVGVALRSRAVARVRPRQQRAAAWLRGAAVAATVLALAGPRWTAAGQAVDVAFLVDASDSVGTAHLAALDWVEQALAAKPAGDRAALARFGRDPRLEYSARQDPPLTPPATVVDGSATDLARALRLGQGVLGSEHRRRVVVFTDGRETAGDGVAAARELAELGVSVDVVSVASGQGADVLVEEVRAPSRVHEGETYDVVGVLRNAGNDPVDVVVVVTRDDVTVARRTVTAAPGRTEVAVPATAEATGTVRYEVRLASGASTIAANDVGRAAVQVDGPPRVLVYEGEPDAGADLAGALTATALPVDRVAATAAAFPSLDRLLDYAAVVLVDVPADALGEAGMLALDAFVRDAGGGLVAVGGDDAFGVGGYEGTPLEDLLPVFARVTDPERRPSVAEALVVDVSGSMAACHCRPSGFAGGPGEAVEGGVNKTDITKEAVARAVRALEDQDLVGVLAFNATAEWVLPLQSLPADATVDDALARLHPDGSTSVPQAVREAIAGLKDANARLRHIVLFTDGFSEDPQMLEVAREAADAGITLSVVGTGEGAGDVLPRMAEAGGGRYYPGRDLLSIPDLIVSEVQLAARPIVNEGEFVPVVTGLAPATAELTRAPALLGYLATTAKPAAQQLLQVGEERDPLLASWRAGLGTAVAWTSDATSRWSARWVTWDAFRTFWSDVVRSTLPAEPDPRYQLTATATTDGLRVQVEAAQPPPTGATATATVTFPDGHREQVELPRTGLDVFAAGVPVAGEGVYAVSVRVSQGDTDLFRDTVTAIASYSPEYVVGPRDEGRLAALAEAGGGRLDPDPAAAFDPVGLDAGASSRALWPWLALLALLVLPVEVGLRRLRLEREDWGRLRSWIAGLPARVRRRRGAVAERSAATEGLLAAKARARAGEDRGGGDRPGSGEADGPRTERPDHQEGPGG